MVKRSYAEFIGRRINSLTIISLGERILSGGRTTGTLRCKCTCGIVKDIYTYKVINNIIKSCGCQWMPSRIFHDLSEHELYPRWQTMKRRCDDPGATGYKNYGGRGIKVCERWASSFENFLFDVGERPSPLHSLDRYPNNDGNYEPGNFRWATRKEQAQNRRPSSKNKPPSTCTTI